MVNGNAVDKVFDSPSDIEFHPDFEQGIDAGLVPNQRKTMSSLSHLLPSTFKERSYGFPLLNGGSR